MKTKNSTINIPTIVKILVPTNLPKPKSCTFIVPATNKNIKYSHATVTIMLRKLASVSKTKLDKIRYKKLHAINGTKLYVITI